MENNQTDLSQITSIEKLESMAYQQVITRDMAVQNLQMIQTRMQQVRVEIDEKLERDAQKKTIQEGENAKKG